MKWVLPESVTVGHLDISIVPMTADEAEKLGQVGYFDNETCKISVLETLPPARQAEVFMHELFHACYFVGHISPRTGEEKTCDAIAMSLAGLIRHNPGLFACLERALSKPAPKA